MVQLNPTSCAFAAFQVRGCGGVRKNAIRSGKRGRGGMSVGCTQLLPSFVQAINGSVCSKLYIDFYKCTKDMGADWNWCFCTPKKIAGLETPGPGRAARLSWAGCCVRHPGGVLQPPSGVLRGRWGWHQHGPLPLCHLPCPAKIPQMAPCGGPLPGAGRLWAK